MTFVLYVTAGMLAMAWVLLCIGMDGFGSGFGFKSSSLFVLHPIVMLVTTLFILPHGMRRATAATVQEQRRLRTEGRSSSLSLPPLALSWSTLLSLTVVLIGYAIGVVLAYILSNNSHDIDSYLHLHQQVDRSSTPVLLLVPQTEGISIDDAAVNNMNKTNNSGKNDINNNNNNNGLAVAHALIGLFTLMAWKLVVSTLWSCSLWNSLISSSSSSNSSSSAVHDNNCTPTTTNSSSSNNKMVHTGTVALLTVCVLLAFSNVVVGLVLMCIRVPRGGENGNDNKRKTTLTWIGLAVVIALVVAVAGMVTWHVVRMRPSDCRDDGGSRNMSDDDDGDKKKAVTISMSTTRSRSTCSSIVTKNGDTTSVRKDIDDDDDDI